MKKLIVLFLLLCSGVIYFIGSGCTGEDSCMGDEVEPEIEGPTVLNCSTVRVPEADFTFATDQNVYCVWETVTYKFTGDKGNGGNTYFRWTLPGTAGAFVNGHETVAVAYPLAGTYSVRVAVGNDCWSSSQIKYDYVTIYDPPKK